MLDLRIKKKCLKTSTGREIWNEFKTKNLQTTYDSDRILKLTNDSKFMQR